MSEALQKAYNDALDQYTRKMQQACKPEVGSMTQESFHALHIKERTAALATYTIKAKALQASHDIDRYLAQLTEDINKREQQYYDQNVVKTEKTIRISIEGFHKEIERITQGTALCLNSLDVDDVHAGAMQVAERAFLLADRQPFLERDWDKHFLVDYLLMKVIELRLLNTKNNKHFGLEVAIKYFQEMVGKCTRDPRLTVEAFNKEHEKARAKALAEFATKRNRPRQFSNDILLSKVEQSIMIQYSQLRQINASAGSKSSFLQSVSVYDQRSLTPSVLWQYCLHPEDLKKNHDDAVCQALLAFRPNRTCSEGFHDSEKDELDLHLLFENRFIALADINSIANQVAEEAGFLEFKFKFNRLANANGNKWLKLSMNKKRECHGKAIVIGLEAFYAKRRDKNHHAADSYRDHLLQRCKNYAGVDQ